MNRQSTATVGCPETSVSQWLGRACHAPPQPAGRDGGRAAHLTVTVEDRHTRRQRILRVHAQLTGWARCVHLAWASLPQALHILKYNYTDKRRKQRASNEKHKRWTGEKTEASSVCWTQVFVLLVWLGLQLNEEIEYIRSLRCKSSNLMKRNEARCNN